MAVVRTGVFWLMAILSVAIALVSYRYLAPGAPGGAPNILANAFTRYGVLTLHAGFAATALLLGSFQFVQGIRRRWPRAHRWIGKVYVVACLGAGAAGLVLAFGATTGPVSTAGFGTLAVLWIACTGNAWRLAAARDFVRHERWMVRSFALTLAAVTLRLYLPMSMVLRLDADTAYRAISFLCWVPNLAIAELLLAGGFRTTPRLAAASQSLG
jgi:uncharacterized membrane protein